MFSSVRVLVAVALTGQNHHCWRNPWVCSWSCHVKNPKCQFLMLVKVALSCRCIIFAGKIMFFFLLTQPRFFIVKSSFPGVKPTRVILESNSFPHFPLQNPHVSHTGIPILGDLLVWNPRFCHIPSISQLRQPSQARARALGGVRVQACPRSLCGWLFWEKNELWEINC